MLTIVAIISIPLLIRLFIILNIPSALASGLGFMGGIAWLAFMFRSELFANFSNANLQSLWPRLLSGAISLFLLTIPLFLGLPYIATAADAALPAPASTIIQIGVVILLIRIVGWIRKKSTPFCCNIFLTSQQTSNFPSLCRWPF